MVYLNEDDEKKLKTLSPYFQAVLRKLATVPKGKVTTYGALAKAVAKDDPQWSPHASRAVGNAMMNNICAPKIPCHRVIKSDGSIGNFRGGEKGAKEEKMRMLQNEGIEMKKGKIDLKKYGYFFE